MPKKKVLFICKQGHSYGHRGAVVKKSGLYNSAKFVADAIGADFVDVLDNNDIDREVARSKPDVVIIEALWVVPEKFAVLKKLHPKVKWYVRIHSDIPFLAYEGIAMEWLAAYLAGGVGVMVNSRRAEQALEYAFPGRAIHYLPNIYPRVPQTHVGSGCDEAIHIGCFGAIRPMKNHLLQAIAAIKFAESKDLELRFHVNVGRVETNGDPVLKNLRSLLGDSLVEHGWLDRPHFLDVLSKIDLGLQVSLTETFNIVAGDMVGVGVPVVVSKEIDWVSDTNKADENSVEDIVEVMEKVSRKKCLVALNRHKLFEYSEMSLEIWKRFLR